MSLLNATRKLLARRKHGLRAAEIIEILTDRGWMPKNGGKTPVATLLAVLHRNKYDVERTIATGISGMFKNERTDRGVVWTLAA
ncbi:MAG: hypothetical protein KGL39_46295 [Patescibacteria group bacterium]|nr:hypothetical protein [Patescibacteria group bacterium]